MKFARVGVFFVLFLILVAVTSVGNAWAKDSRSLHENDVIHSVKATSGAGVPLGTIIAWPIASWDKLEGKENYHLCDGSVVSSSAYPELYAAGIHQFPKLNGGQFLRGAGGKAAPVGVEQGDAIRNVKGGFSGVGEKYNLPAHCIETVEGPFYVENTSFSSEKGVPINSRTDNNDDYIGFDLSRVVPTADENRPMNIAVVYLIRAKP